MERRRSRKPTEFGLRLEAERRLTPRLALVRPPRAPGRRNVPRPEPWLDGPAGEIGVGLGVTWVALPILAPHRPGRPWSWARANDEALAHARARCRQASGATLALPAGFTVGFARLGPVDGL